MKKSMRNKTIIFLGDGMADEPILELGNRTPLQVAHTPGMDSIARDGRSGTLFTLPEGYPTSSEVANMSVLGCDLASEYCGRGPLEALAQGISLGPDDKAFRLNIVTTVDGILTDYSGGHLAPRDAEELVAALNQTFGNDSVRFYPGVSYRTILILSGPGHSHKVKTDKPDDNHGEKVLDHLPRALIPGAEPTVALLQKMIHEAPAILEAHPVNRRLAREGKPLANGIWPWSGGTVGAMRAIKSKYGVSGAVITAVDVIRGLGRSLGMDVIDVAGATGYIDTNYEGKASAAIDALNRYDFVYVHLEAIDEVSHAKDLKLKMKAIEDFDARIISPVLKAVGPLVNVAVLPDHPVPLYLGKHTRTPVPVSVRMAGIAPDGINAYNEIDCPRGALGPMRDGDLMKLLFGVK